MWADGPREGPDPDRSPVFKYLKSTAMAYLSTPRRSTCAIVVSTIILYRYFVSVMLAPFSHDATTSEAKELYTLIGLVALLFAGATAAQSGIARFDGDVHASHRGLLVALAVVYGALALHVYPTIARDILVGFVMYGLYAASPAATGHLTKHVTEQSGIVQNASGNERRRLPREIDREIAPRVVRLELSLASACHIGKLLRGCGSESGGFPSDGLLVVEYANVLVDDWDSRRYPLCRPFFGQPGEPYREWSRALMTALSAEYTSELDDASQTDCLLGLDPGGRAWLAAVHPPGHARARVVIVREVEALCACFWCDGGLTSLARPGGPRASGERPR